jgi:uroporphyrinogen decarboxylase
MKTFEENVKWRLNPDTSERYTDLENQMALTKEAQACNLMMTQWIIGGYMYLRSLIGPVDLLYKFYDNPELIHACMETWLCLAEAVTARHQAYVPLDEVFFGEDICYNKGPLISPDMIREFLFPYYQQLIANIRSRQLDKSRHLYIQIDTDGKCEPVIPLYQEMGVDVMSPFEVASGSDVVEIGKKFPDLVISGGIDKRVLSKGKEAIDMHLDYILPAMHTRGGYIPTCDHGVPEEVSLENYKYYRKKCLEYG